MVLKMKVKDCMCKNVVYIRPETSVCDCAHMMQQHHVGCIPVCDCHDNMVGLVTDRDIILRTVACNKNAQTTPVSEVMTCNVCCCPSEADIKEAEHLMETNKVRRLPVIENNKIIGILTLGDLAANADIDNKEVSQTLETICKDDKQNAE